MNNAAAITITTEQVEQFHEEGFFILEEALSAGQLELLRTVCDQAVRELDAGMDARGVEVEGINRKGNRYFIGQPSLSYPALREVLYGEVVADICRATLGDKVQMGWEQFVVKGAEQGMKFSWHQDCAYADSMGAITLPACNSCWCALDDMTEANGTVYMLPYSRGGGGKLVPHVRDEEINDLVGYFGDDPGIPVIVPAGGIAVFSGLAFHRSGFNTTKKMRRVYLAQYSTEPAKYADGTDFGRCEPFLEKGIKSIMTKLRAGAALVDITPQMGTQIAGDIGRRRPVDEIRDPLYAHALVLDNGERKICILSLDVTIITSQWATSIREQAAQRFGFEFGAVAVHATQVHSAPAIGHHFALGPSEWFPEDQPWLKGGDDAYHSFAVQRAVEAIGKANANLQPVTVGAASGIEARIAFNRRFVMRDGSGRTHPTTGDPHIRHAEGPIDPEVGIVCFRGEDEQVVAALLHYTCHPNHGYPMNYISADWPGAWCDGVRELMGPQCVPIVINGCCGNIHHSNHLDKHAASDFKRMGAYLTETTKKILPEMEYRETNVLEYTDTFIELPWREVPAEVQARAATAFADVSANTPDNFDQARAILREHPEPMWLDDEHTRVDWSWVYAVSMLDLERQMQEAPSARYEVQGFRIGDIGIVVLPGEPFVEAQLRIKMESPTYPTYVAHMSNMYAGYIPTAEALARGGYETRLSNGSKHAPESLEMIIDSSGQALRRLFNV